MSSFPKKHILQNERANYQPKKLFTVKKNVTAKDKRPLLLFGFTDFEQAFVADFVYFFFL